MNGHDKAKALYQPAREMKQDPKRTEKATAPDHCNKYFESREQEQKQRINHE